MGTNNSPAAASAALPELNDAYALTAAQIASFQTNGHICLRGVAAPEEVAVYRPYINRAAALYNTETRPIAERDTYGKAFLQIMNLWTRDEVVRRFTCARRFARIAAELVGAAGVRLYHDQALFKEPGGGPTPWHQDQHYWPLDTDKMITMWMPLVPVPEEVGSMTFASGSHRVGYLGDLPISDESEAELQRFIAARGLKTHSYGTMQPGDATFHAGWTLHSARGNPTDQTRAVMTIIWHASDARVTAPDNKNRQADLETWLPGLQPGDLAASPLNPLIYHR